MPTVLIDGSNMWYRAYTGTPLTPPGGPMLIMYNMVKKLVQNFGAHNLIFCWDSAGDGGRREIDTDYKANRKAVEGVWEHLIHGKDLLSALGLSSAIAEGFEADDAIGSLAQSIEDDILIASYDRDFYQLITDRVKVYHAARKIRGVSQPEKIITKAEAEEHFGCIPAKIPLVKAFKGDPSDNIPKLNITFGKKFKEQFFRVVGKSISLEDFYSNLEDFDADYRSKLVDFKERASLNYSLVLIRKDAPVKTEKNTLDPHAVEALCNKFQITSIKIPQWKAAVNSFSDNPTPEVEISQKTLFD